ncbi:MAG: phytanoyl-CoA dioxygenase family protein [Candidatus Latescibacteria bacterium]|nr:phytanoyl-CoA dioxygenase family protein [Candidatus Latescibacterota bacterium]
MPRSSRYQLSVQDYIDYHEQGFVIIRGLVSSREVAELRRHTEALMYGRITVEGVEPPPAGLSREEQAQHWLRVHMLHRKLDIHERFLLHPRMLDVLETLIGPDVLALQTMLFLKPPGREGQGYHQDSYYIPTYPDTLCGAWLAIDRADEENGCVWLIPGSHHEPIYPDRHKIGQNHADGAIRDLTVIEHASATDDSINGLTPIAAKYPGQEIPAVLDPGDVMIFHSHLLHRSHTNRSQTRFRRAFVGHYCNARSWVPWNHGMPFEGPSANYLHILARGNTHLPYAKPKFGTPCAALNPRPVTAGTPPPMMMGNGKKMTAVTPRA